ncbi:hypothetical protein [Salinisphaera hydrothermalis]|nr:hypothetical protein [Salinisphaera hydrothermalis]
MATLNTKELLAIRDEEVARSDRRLVDFKYFNIRPWIVENIKRALRLGLDDCRGRRILDIGTGFGYFPYICEFMEHHAAALDIPGHRLYDRVIETLKVDRAHHFINPFEPLPASSGPHDYVTAYQVAFNRPGTDERWRAAEWAFFLEDVIGHHLAASGRLHMELNWSFPIGDWYDSETRKLFDSYGAVRVGNEVDIVKR